MKSRCSLVLAATMLVAALAGCSTGRARSVNPLHETPQLAGFRLGMNRAEAESIIRKLRQIEEPWSEPQTAFDCSLLLSEDSDDQRDSGARPVVPISYYIDAVDHHVLDVFFAATPEGARVSGIWLWNHKRGASWASYLADAIARFGAPDRVRPVPENGGMSATWCLAGGAECESKEAPSVRLSWVPRAGRKGGQTTSGILVLAGGWELEEGQTEEFLSELYKTNPEKARVQYQRCRALTDNLEGPWAVDAHLAGLSPVLDGWSPAVGEPRLVHGGLFTAIDEDAEAVIRQHSCAIRRSAGVNDLACDARSEFRWVRQKDDLSVVAMRDLSVESTVTPSGTSNNERRVYHLVRHGAGKYERLWSGESLLALSAELRLIDGDRVDDSVDRRAR